LSYHFEPNAEDDGVSVNIQLGILNQVKLEGFDWHIPALREERIAHLIKSLPKALRRNFVPAPNFAGAIMADVEPMQGRLTDAMATKLRRMTGVTVPEENWDESSLPAHLRMNFKIFDGKKLVSQGRDLQSLQQQLSGKVQQRLEKTAGDDISREQVDSWDFDDLPEVITERQQGFELKAYPGLINKGKGQVALQLFDNPEQAKQHHKTGVRELLLQQIPSPVKHLQKSLSNKAKLAMYFNPWGKVDALIADCIAAAVDGLIQEQIEQGNKLRDKQSFGQLKDVVRANLNERVEKIALEVEQCLLLSQQVRKALKGKIPLDQIQSRGDIQDQLDNLVFAGFVSAYGSHRLSDIVRYLKAIQRRLEKLPVDPNKDRLMTLTLANLEEQYKAVVKAYENKGSVVPDDVAEIRWMIEELRVSFFAQTLGTKYPVSEKRVKQAIEAAK